MIEGVFDRSTSYRRENGRLVVKFLDGHVINCDLQSVGQNPARYKDVLILKPLAFRVTAWTSQPP